MGPLLVLVGPPASGKTTVGTAVAEIFVTDGEPHFRALEEQAVARALAEHDGVLALGGGAVTSAAARELLVAYGQAGGVVVWLDVDLHSAAKRVGLSRDRPLLNVNPRAMLRTMLEQRAQLYTEVATHKVATAAREPDDVIAEVTALVRPRQDDR